MKISLVILGIICLLFSLVTGCTTNNPPEKPASELPSLTLYDTTNSTPEGSQIFWITIDPIHINCTNEMNVLTGKTNLNESEELSVQLMTSWWRDPKKRTQCAGEEVKGATAIIRVNRGNASDNYWNFSIVTSYFPADEYYLSVTGVKVNASAESIFYFSGCLSNISVSNCSEKAVSSPLSNS